MFNISDSFQQFLLQLCIFSLNQVITKLLYQFDSLHCHLSVIILFRLWKIAVWGHTRILFFIIITFPPVGPSSFIYYTTYLSLKTSLSPQQASQYLLLWCQKNRPSVLRHYPCPSRRRNSVSAVQSISLEASVRKRRSTVPDTLP